MFIVHALYSFHIIQSSRLSISGHPVSRQIMAIHQVISQLSVHPKSHPLAVI